MCFNLTADVILLKGLKKGIWRLKLEYFTVVIFQVVFNFCHSHLIDALLLHPEKLYTGKSMYVIARSAENLNYSKFGTKLYLLDILHSYLLSVRSEYIRRQRIFFITFIRKPDLFSRNVSESWDV